MAEKKTPMRRCVGCMESRPKRELIRIAGNPENGVCVDPTGKAKGRGVYLCPNLQCMEKAKKRKALERGLKMSLSEEDAERIFREFSEYANKNS